MIRLKHLFILAMTTIVIVSMSGCIYLLELSYDDGDANHGTGAGMVGVMFAVRFTPPKKCLLVKAKFYIWRYPATFKVHVMDSAHEDLITPFEATPTSEGWFEVGAFPPLIVGSEDFYIAMECVTSPPFLYPFIGSDDDDPDGRSEIGAPPPPYTWTRMLNYDFMIRAVVIYIDIQGSYPLEEYL